MSSEAIASPAERRRTPFAPHNRWDHDFFLVWVLLVWVGIVMGFGKDIIHHFQSHEAAYPLIVHFHAAVFVSFLVLLTTQVFLIRNNRPDIHRKLGIAGFCLAAVMLVLGPATAIVMQRAQFGTPDSDPSFISIQFIGIFDFFVLIVAAALLRGNAPAHKRLILLAILAISDAGFSRWLADDVHAWLGSGFWPLFAEFFLATDILVLGLGAYDLITRKRLHPVYIVGAVWIFACQFSEVFLYRAPAWKTVALRIIGH
jgi:uncharacterized membrane protein YozB (DUF420 family)